jgi:hypothetical protein
LSTTDCQAQNIENAVERCSDVLSLNVAFYDIANNGSKYSVVEQSRIEQHHFNGAGAVMRCGSGYSSKLVVQHTVGRLIKKNVTNCNNFLLFPFTFISGSIIKSIRNSPNHNVNFFGLKKLACNIVG